MMRLLVIMILVCAGSCGLAQTGIITTIAGCDTAGYGGDGGTCGEACLNFPETIYPDASGNIYIADAGNARIRRIEAATGLIFTVAGTGTLGYFGDGGLAINAELFGPSAVYVDFEQNVLVADALNSRIRKINSSTHVITTVAGNGIDGHSGDNGLAIDAKISNPSGICSDKFGNVYFTEYHNNCIRKISTTGIISTIAGTGASGYSGDGSAATLATFSGPFQIACDTSNNLLVTDMWNSVIRKIDLTSGLIITIAGTSTNGYSGDGGLATDADLRTPNGIYVDKQNNIYFTEYYNGTVRRVDGATNIITTIVGYGTPGFGGDGGPASNAKLQADFAYVDDNGDMYIADAGNNRIRKVTNIHPTSIGSGVQNYKIKIQPNPTAGIFAIEGPKSGTFRIEVVNSLGQSVYANKSVVSNQSIDVSFLPSGVYFVQIGDNQSVYTEKLIVQH